MTGRGDLWRGCAATLCALLGFAGTNALVGARLEPYPGARLLRNSVENRKFSHLAAHEQDYDLIYVGTSRVHRGFDPGVFDARMAELGHPTHSYNFGLVGLGYLEELYLVAWTLEHRPPGLRTLLVEPIDFDVRLEQASQLTLRDVNWHDLIATERGLEAAWNSERTLGQKLELTRSHLVHAAHRLCNVGVVSNMLGSLLDREVEKPLEPLPAGFGGVDPDTDHQVRGGHGNRNTEPQAASPVTWQIVREIAERARAAGVQILFVIPPTTKALDEFLDAVRRGWMPELLVYPREKIPKLFSEHDTYFLDEGHLNAKGAKVFSRRLATDLAPRLASGG